MVNSMTGYGNSHGEDGSQAFAIEIRTLNHRFLDISIKLPGQLSAMEDKIKKIIKSKFNRGRIEVFITIEDEKRGNKEVRLNRSLLHQSIQELEEAKTEFNLSGSISIEMLMMLDDIFLVEDKKDKSDGFEESLYEHLSIVIEKVCAMRKIRRERAGKRF